MSIIMNEYNWELGNRIYVSPTAKFRTRPLTGTASGMASDSVRGRVSTNITLMCPLYIKLNNR